MTSASGRRLAALLVAGGRGTRLGAEIPKQFLELAGRPMFEHAARVLHAAPEVSTLYVVATPGWESRMQEALVAAGLEVKLRAVVAGGATRQESVQRGLAAIEDATHVLVHDAARPFPTAALVRETAAAAFEHGAATAALRVTDTLFRAAGSGAEPASSAGGAAPVFASETLQRENVWSVQTPQAFEIELLREAHRQAHRSQVGATDDGGLVMALGHRVALVPGPWWNIKVTRDEDLRQAEMLAGWRARSNPEVEA